MVFDVQAMVSRSQEELQPKYSLETRSQTSIEKRNSFANQLKKISQKQTVSSSDISEADEFSTKTNAENSQNLQQTGKLVESGDGEAGSQVSVQEKQIVPTQAEETSTSGDVKQPLVAYEEQDPSMGTDAQLLSSDEAAQMSTVITIQLPQVAPLSEAVIDATSAEKPDVSMESALPPKTGNKIQGLNYSLYPTAETILPQGTEADGWTQGKVSSPVAEIGEQAQGQETEKTARLVSESLTQIRSMEETVPTQSTSSAIEETVPMSSKASPTEEADQPQLASSTMKKIGLWSMESTPTEEPDIHQLSSSTVIEADLPAMESSPTEKAEQSKLTSSAMVETLPLSTESSPMTEDQRKSASSTLGEADLPQSATSPIEETDLPHMVSSLAEKADLPKSVASPIEETDFRTSTYFTGEKTNAALAADSMAAEPVSQGVQAVAGGESSTADDGLLSPIPVVSNQTGNTQTALDDGQEIAQEMNSSLRAEANISTESEKNPNKKDSKAQGKSRMNMRLLEEPLLNQAVKKTDESVNTNVKKIIDLESQRITKKVPTKLIVQDDTTLIKSGDTQLQSLTTLDKNPLEVIKPGLESGKALLADTSQSTGDTQEIIDQIVKKVELLNKVVGSEMKIQLKPEFLGKMVIDIAVNDGVVTARFTTENQHVKQVLEANMNSLKQTLEANGLKVERTEVNVQLDNGGNFNGSEGNRQHLWQEMTSQGRSTTSYSQFNSAESSEVEELTPYQREADTTRTVNEGRVDFVI